MSLNIRLFRHSLPTFARISLGKKVNMKPCQAIRSLSLFTMITMHRFWSVGAKNCTIMTTRQRFTQMLGVTEQGHCACAKRDITTEATPPTPPKDPSTVNIEELKAMIAANDIQLIDVREPYELQESGKIPNSVNVPLGDIPDAFTMKPKQFMEKYNAKKPKRKDANIVFHCKAGIRSKHALNQVHQLGFKMSRHYPGGFDDWETCLKRGNQ
ncbi:thiosulfate sulfurtransferase/rhodanese-like domain-containing protein 3 [Exaiptasia diaphana]|uniref:Rhodanese domain-containing protein n=1 Tax=Exaiptasia diaphana TaxID=2652724 RepID=A0A913XRA8_EXADI|nr:thiosulfate sulfurtransferase/rhodanese-like domain-containing protein 3 [Exaiptasia diaphana]KXJ25192.1 Thiosulfate sulfurtransferase/rhodanese-like domain-containing protein 3 [Exaiptasia diaphana]